MKHHAALEIVELTPKWELRLGSFLRALEKNGEDSFFRPHLATRTTIRKLAARTGKDVYCLLVESERVLGYGLLRGWDEGYEIPSLGIAIHPSARKGGLGSLLMHFLHASAFRRGAKKVRLRVRKKNSKAIKLYTDLGYVLKTQNDDHEYLVGFKDLRRR